MNVLKFLLSKLVFIIFILMLGYIYLYHEQIKTELAEINKAKQAEPLQQQSQQVLQQKNAKPSVPDRQTTRPEKVVVKSTVATVPEKPLPNMDIAGLTLKDARRLFWQQQYDAAISAYQQLIEKEQHNPDYHGELGNIYMSLNKPEQAAEQFVSTARILVDNGDLFRVQQLLGVLYAIDANKAQEVRNYLQQKSNRP